MTAPNTTLVRFLVWMAQHLRLTLDLATDRLVDPIDEHDILEELHFGRG